MQRRNFLKSTALSATAYAVPTQAQSASNLALQQTYTNIISQRSELDRFISVDGEQQLLHICDVEDGLVAKVRNYPVSTGKNGFGNKNGSGKTPIGYYEVEAKGGKDAPFGTYWAPTTRSRHFRTNLITPDEDTPGKPVICTRYLVFNWYRGTHLHGTNKEGSIGKPDSGGCIRTKNTDIIEIFDLTLIGTPIHISANLEDEMNVLNHRIKKEPLRAVPIQIKTN